MSYDLYFTPNRNSPTHDEFVAYFADREGYTVENSPGYYENEDTGVYFCFDFNEPGDDADDEASHLSFNINYYRPHYFGLEASPEVTAFIQRFDLGVIDPQADGMDDGPFSVDGFLRGWNAGNRFAYRAILSGEDRPEVFVYPTDGLERAWKWNYARAALQDEFAESLFVPKLMFMKSGGRACTAVVWPNACPIYMPKADLVFLIRDDLPTRSSRGGSGEMTIAKWEQITPIVSAFPQSRSEVPFFQLDYEDPPDSVVDFVRSQPDSPPGQEMGIANGDVLNEELVAEALKTAT